MNSSARVNMSQCFTPFPGALNTILSFSCENKTLWSVWEDVKQSCVCSFLLPTYLCLNHILADKLQSLQASVYLKICSFFLGSQFEVISSQCGLSYWQLCASPSLWSGESTEMKTGTIKGHMHTKFAASHSDMSNIGLMCELKVLVPF